METLKQDQDKIDELYWAGDDIILTPPPPKESYRVTCKVIKVEKIK